MAANLKAFNILVIEGDEMLSEVMLVTFELAGATVRVAHSGETGLQLFHEMNPDLVVLDVRLPGITGWAVLKFIRIVSDTPIVMLTTRREDQDQVKGLSGGADAYLTKPFSAEVLVAQLVAVLRRSKKGVGQYDIEHNPRDPIYILTERGVGYRFEPQ